MRALMAVARSDRDAVTRFDVKGSESDEVLCAECQCTVDVAAFVGRCLSCYLEWRKTIEQSSAQPKPSSSSAATALALSAALKPEPLESSKPQKKRKRKRHF